MKENTKKNISRNSQDKKKFESVQEKLVELEKKDEIKRKKLIRSIVRRE